MEKIKLFSLRKNTENLIKCIGGLEGHYWLQGENGQYGIDLLLVKLGGGEAIWENLCCEKKS